MSSETTEWGTGFAETVRKIVEPMIRAHEEREHAGKETAPTVRMGVYDGCGHIGPDPYATPGGPAPGICPACEEKERAPTPAPVADVQPVAVELVWRVRDLIEEHEHFADVTSNWREDAARQIVRDYLTPTAPPVPAEPTMEAHVRVAAIRQMLMTARGAFVSLDGHSYRDKMVAAIDRTIPLLNLPFEAPPVPAIRWQDVDGWADTLDTIARELDERLIGVGASSFVRGAAQWIRSLTAALSGAPAPTPVVVVTDAMVERAADFVMSAQAQWGMVHSREAHQERCRRILEAALSVPAETQRVEGWIDLSSPGRLRKRQSVMFYAKHNPEENDLPATLLIHRPPEGEPK